MQRYLGIDFGKARIGIAKSDPLGLIASGVETINWDGEKLDYALERIEELVSTYEITAIVLGLPRRTDYKQGQAETKVKEFADVLKERIDLPIYFQDERLTSVMAQDYLHKGQSHKKSYRSKIDQVAAEIILQDFLEKQRNLQKKENDNV